MRLVPQSLAGQMIAVTVLATVLTQTLIMFGVYLYTNARFERFGDDFEFHKIVQTVEYVNAVQPSKVAEILTLSQSEDLKLHVSQTALGLTPLDQSYRKDDLTRFLGGYEVQTSIRKINIADVLGIIFGNRIETCVEKWQTVTIDERCPHWTISIRLNDGSWLNVQSSGNSDFTIFLLPIVLSALTSLLGIGGSVSIWARRITRPLRGLSHAAEVLGRGEAAPEIPATGPVEVARLAQAFNQMQDRLTRFIRDRTAMLAAINHDLRTPITSLRLRAEFIEEEALKSEMIATTEDMRTMVDSYLAFSRQDATEEEKQHVDLTEMLQDMAGATPEMEFHGAEPAGMSCRPVAIKRVFHNLIGNGIKYGTRLEVFLTQDTERVVIDFCDAGPGIPADRFEDVFTPFTRLDSSRNVSDGNVGLGLTIARSIVRKHGGDITPLGRDEGFCMRVIIPK